MKQLFFACTLSIIISCTIACNSAQSEAQNTADVIQKTMKENSPGSIATSVDGYYLKAKLDGKDWSASHMTPDNDAQSSFNMIHAVNNEGVVKLQLWKRGVEVGRKIPFSETNMANLFIEGDANMYGGKIGEIEIKRFDEQWIEGTFHFTATTTTSDKKIEVTDGSFRIASGLNK